MRRHSPSSSSVRWSPTQATSSFDGPPGRREPKKRLVRCAARPTRAVRSHVVDAVPGGRHRLEPGLPDGLATALAEPVGALVELLERTIDVVELLAQRPGQRPVLTLLGRDLGRVGEVLVEVEALLAVGLELAELSAQVTALGLE